MIGSVPQDDPCSDADYLGELWDDRARALTEHLERVAHDESGWEIFYVCPLSGQMWLRDYPHSAEQGGGPMRLRVVRETPDWASDTGQ